MSAQRGRAAGSGVDKWKNKYWIDIRVPDYIGDSSLGQTPASDLSNVIGRTVKKSLMDLTNDFDDLNYLLKFKITRLQGNRAKTEVIQQELNRDYRRSQIRNHRSQIDGIFNLKLNDGSRIRVTVFIVTPVRAAHNTKKAIRRAAHEKIKEYTKDLSYPAFIERLINYELRDELLPATEEEFPIKILEIAKVKILKLPKDRQMMDPDDIETPDKQESLEAPTDEEEEDTEETDEEEE